MDRNDDRRIWEAIFSQAPESWKTVGASDLMVQCASFLAAYRVERVLDLGSGFGRWTNFLANEMACSVVGVDCTVGGSLLGLELRSEGTRAGFVSADVTALPFQRNTFDGFLAVLILDNLMESDAQVAIEELSRVVGPGSPGFVVLNPWPMPHGIESEQNQTRDCTRRDYSDEEAMDILFSDWEIADWSRVEHGFRSFQIRT